MAKTAIEKMSTKKKDREIFSVRVSNRKTTTTKIKKKEKITFEDEDEQSMAFKSFSKNLSKSKKIMLHLRNRNKISYDSLSYGSVVGCCVSKVFNDRLLVSLPFRMKGFIPLTHISEHYTRLLKQVAAGEEVTEEVHSLSELFQIGQFLIASVANTRHDLKGYVGLPLSLYASDVNGSEVSVTAVQPGMTLQASVTSVEDNGYSLDSGVRGVTAAFLPSSAVPEDKLVAVGSVLQCMVTAVKGSGEAHSLTLTAMPDQVLSALSKAVQDSSSVVTPGTLLQCVVVKSGPEGVRVLVGSEEDYFHWVESDQTSSNWLIGNISPHHLRGPFDQGHLFRTGQKVQGRVLLFTRFPKQLHLTLNKNVFSLGPTSNVDGPELGTIVSDASVISTSVDGICFRINNKYKGVCPLSQVPGNSKLKSLAKKYTPGSKVRCKLIMYNAMDQLYVVSLRPADLNNEDDSEELKIGMVINVTIAKYTESGARVLTEGNKRGFVYRHHLTDTNIANPEMKLPVGKTVRAKVLNIIEKKVEGCDKIIKRFYFTLKKALIDSDLPIVATYDESNINIETLGIVCRCGTDRLCLEFFGGTRGLLNVSLLPLTANIAEDYRTGVLISVVISGLLLRARTIYALALPTTPVLEKKPVRMVKKPSLTHEQRLKELSRIDEMNRRLTRVGWLSKVRSTLAFAVGEKNTVAATVSLPKRTKNAKKFERSIIKIKKSKFVKSQKPVKRLRVS